MFSTAMAEKPAANGTRSRTSATFVGSLTTRPSGTTLPAASPIRYALKASQNERRCGPSKQSVHARARTPKRRPASISIATKPQPIFEMSDQISEGPACQTKYANSARPIAAKAIPAGARLLVVPSAFTFSAITNFVRPRGPLGFFVGATTIRQQRPPPQMPARRRAQTQTNRVPRAALCADSASFQAKARLGSPSGRGAFAACDGRLLHAALTPEQLFRRAARVCDTIMAARPPGRA